MQKRLNKKIENYITGFKDSLRNKISDLKIEDNLKVNDILEYIYDYDRLVLEKEDFIKRKRVKNSIPSTNRCNAKRANGEQCTRRRKIDCEFCGTHYKGIPHGLINEESNTEFTPQKMDVFAEDIKGIVYYIDHYSNVYKTESILSGKENPEIIAKWKMVDGKYTIPEFGLV